MKFVFSPDVILCGWLGTKHQLVDWLASVHICEHFGCRFSLCSHVVSVVGRGCSSAGRALDQHVADACCQRMLPTHVWFPGVARDISPRINFQCRLCYGVRTPSSAVACIFIYTHVRDPMIHVRVWLIMYSMYCRLGSVTRGLLSLGKATRISHGRNPIGTIQL